MARFRTIPTVIEAVQITEENVFDLATKWKMSVEWSLSEDKPKGLRQYCLPAPASARIGDWLIEYHDQTLLRPAARLMPDPVFRARYEPAGD